MRKSLTTDGPTRLRSDRRQKYCDELVKRDGNQCFYCTRPFVDEAAKLRTLDHLLPVSRGGTHWFENLVLCCRKCNNAKGSLTYEEYILTDGYRVRLAWWIRQKGLTKRSRIEVVRDLVVT